MLSDTDPNTYVETLNNPAGQVYQSERFPLPVSPDLTSVKVKVAGYIIGTTASRVIGLYQGTTLVKSVTITPTGSDVETVVALTSAEAGSMVASAGQWTNLSIRVTDTVS